MAGQKGRAHTERQKPIDVRWLPQGSLYFFDVSRME